MEAFEGAIKADGRVLVVMVKCSLLYRRVWFGERVGKVHQMNTELLLEPFFAKETPAMPRISTFLPDKLSLTFDLINILTGSFQTRSLYCVASPASPQRLIISF